MQSLQKVSAQDKNSRFYAFTYAQVCYKLGNFKGAVEELCGPHSELYGDIGD